MELDPKQRKKLERLANHLEKEDLATVEQLTDIEQRIEDVSESLHSKIAESSTKILEKMDITIGDLNESLKKKLESELVLEIDREELKGEKGEPGEKGDRGETVIVEKIIEKTEVIKETPIVTENVIEKAVADKPEVLRDKLETLEGEDRLDKKAVKGLDKMIEQDTLDRAISILDQRTSFLINKVSNLSEQGTGGGTWGSITGTLSNQTDLQTALDAKADLSGDTFTGDISVPDEAYGAGWNGSLEVPTKNAIYDKIETLATGVSSVSNSDNTITVAPTTGDVVVGLNLVNENTWAAKQTFVSDVYTVKLPDTSTNTAGYFAHSTSQVECFIGQDGVGGYFNNGGALTGVSLATNTYAVDAIGVINASSYRVGGADIPVSYWLNDIGYITGISGLDHNVLGNLTVGDVHTQYAYLAGRSGGQSLIGGTASGNNLTLRSTSNATRGKVIFGNAGTTAYDEVNERWGFGTASPSDRVHLLATRSSNLTANIQALHVDTTYTPASNETTYTSRGAFFNSKKTGSFNSLDVRGFQTQAENQGSGTMTSLYGFLGGVSNIGTGTVTNGYGSFIVTPAASASNLITNVYGLYIDTQAGTGKTNAYGFYSAGTSDTNYLAGKLGVGQTSVSGLKVGITNTTAGDNVLRLTAASLQSASYLSIRTSTGVSAFEFTLNSLDNADPFPKLNIGVGAGSGYGGSPFASLDISNGVNALIIGANQSSTLRTDATNKVFRMCSAPYNSSAIVGAILIGFNSSSASTLNWGGGTSVTNAVTAHNFYTAADITTPTGTLRASITSNGNSSFADGGGDYGSRLAIVSDSASKISLRVYGASSQTANLTDWIDHNVSGLVQASITAKGGLILNEQGLDVDSRFEGDTDANLFYLDASADTVQIGATTASDSAKFYVSGKISTSSEMEINGALNHDGSTVGFYGVTPVVQSPTYTVSNVTTDRTYDANATTVNELADVLGSLIADLKATGIIG